VADFGHPRLLSRIKTPPFFASGNDLWDVTVSGDHAFLADTYNGVFVINVACPEGPYFEGYRRLDVCLDAQYRHEPSVQQLCQPVGGLAVITGHVLAASAATGLHVLEAPVDAPPPSRMAAARIRRSSTIAEPVGTLFHPASQVHGLAIADQSLVVAAGDGGLYVLDDAPEPTVEEHVQTEGFAMDVKCDGQHFLVAEGSAGLSVWRLKSGHLV